RLVSHLDAVGISYMVVGSLASSSLGIARTTFDADLVIAPTPEQLDEFLCRIEPAAYFDWNTARRALRERSMFNIVDLQCGCKADLIILKDRPFERTEFSRRRATRFPDSNSEMWTASAEDTVISKLVWARLGDSQRQFRDAAEVVGVQK